MTDQGFLQQLEQRIEHEYRARGVPEQMRVPSVAFEDFELGEIAGVGRAVAYRITAARVPLRPSPHGHVMRIYHHLDEDWKMLPELPELRARDITLITDPRYSTNPQIILTEAFGWNGTLFTIEPGYDANTPVFMDEVSQVPRSAQLQYISEIGTHTATALSGIHAAGGVHRDVKPPNIGINYSFNDRDLLIEKVLLGDLEFISKQYLSSRISPGVTTRIGQREGIIGTPFYLPDSYLSGERTLESFSPFELDGYALGMTLRVLMMGDFDIAEVMRADKWLEERRKFLALDEKRWSKHERALHMAANRAMLNRYEHMEAFAQALGQISRGEYERVLKDPQTREAWFFRAGEERARYEQHAVKSKRRAQAAALMALLTAGIGIPAMYLHNHALERAAHAAVGKPCESPEVKAFEGAIDEKLAHDAPFYADYALEHAKEERTVVFGEFGNKVMAVTGHSNASEHALSQDIGRYLRHPSVELAEIVAHDAATIDFDLHFEQGTDTTDFSVSHLGRFHVQLEHLPTVLRSVRTLPGDPVKIKQLIASLEKSYVRGLAAGALVQRRYDAKSMTLQGLTPPSTYPVTLNTYREHFLLPLLIASATSPDAELMLSPRSIRGTSIDDVVATFRPERYSDLVTAILATGITSKRSFIAEDGSSYFAAKVDEHGRGTPSGGAASPEKHEHLLLGIARRIEFYNTLMSPSGAGWRARLRREQGRHYAAYMGNLGAQAEELKAGAALMMDYDARMLHGRRIYPVAWGEQSEDDNATTLAADARARIGRVDEAAAIEQALLAQGSWSTRRELGLLRKSVYDNKDNFGWLRESDNRLEAVHEKICKK